MATHDDQHDDEQVQRAPVPPIALPRPITDADVARLKEMAERGRRAEEAARRILEQPNDTEKEQQS